MAQNKVIDIFEPCDPHGAYITVEDGTVIQLSKPDVENVRTLISPYSSSTFTIRLDNPIRTGRFFSFNDVDIGIKPMHVKQIEIY